MADELKPCPFCGAAADQDYRQSYRDISTGNLDHAAAVYCTSCSAHMTYCRGDSPDLADFERMALIVEAWNKRAEPRPSSAIPEDTARLIEEYRAMDDYRIARGLTPVFCHRTNELSSGRHD